MAGELRSPNERDRGKRTGTAGPRLRIESEAKGGVAEQPESFLAKFTAGMPQSHAETGRHVLDAYTMRKVPKKQSRSALPRRSLRVHNDSDVLARIHEAGRVIE